jgi:hypothetical protein
MEEHKLLPEGNAEKESKLNTDAGNLQQEDISSSNETVLPNTEINEPEEPSTLNSQSSTEQNMEVHHHSHNPAEPHHKKNWKSYFWEFLMLFLAVFCGFLAEYQLEHKIERERGKQYIRSFYNDLKTDTAEFEKLIYRYENKINALTTRRECFDSFFENKGNSNACMAQLIKNCQGFPDFVNADQTLLQLKNAGGLRLLKKADADSILEYDKQVRFFIKFETTGYQERQYRIRELLYTIRNYKNIDLNNANPNIPILITNEPEKINQFFVMLNEYATASNTHLQTLKDLKISAAGLIDYFKNKYHFD